MSSKQRIPVKHSYRQYKRHNDALIIGYTFAYTSNDYIYILQQFIVIDSYKLLARK